MNILIPSLLIGIYILIVIIGLLLSKKEIGEFRQ